MVEKRIQDLCNLYTEMTRRFREIREECFDEEDALERATLSDIKDYLMGLLEILPRDVTVHFEDRLTLYFLQDAACQDGMGGIIHTDIVLVGDSMTYGCMSLDEKFYSMKFSGFEKKVEGFHLGTLEFMCANWREVKKAICHQVAETLDDYIQTRLRRVKGKAERLKTFNDWGL